MMLGQAALAAAYAGADHGKRQELIEAIQREYETLKKTATTGPKIITSKELMRKTFTPRKWVVENLIGPGLSILSGASKIGKSWLLFALAESASTGGKFLDYYTVNKTSVLHLSLEDTERGIKERREILRQKQRGFSGADNLFIATEWDTGPSGLETYLRAHNEIEFVIIDTLGAFMPDIEDMNEYADTVKAMRVIKKIADTLDISILAVHHAKKGSGKENQGDWMDQSLGSQGIVGSADTVILLQRDIEKTTEYWTDKEGKKHNKTVSTGKRLNTGRLYATGRSIKDTFHKVEYFPDFGMWGITDKGKDHQNQNGERDETDPSHSEKILTRETVKE